jgi:hypothetical protein
VLDQAHGGGVVRADELDLEVTHEAVVDAVDAHVEVLDAPADRDEERGHHAAGVVVRDGECLGPRVRGAGARAPGGNRDRHGLRPALDARHVEHARGVHAAGGRVTQRALEGNVVLLVRVGRDVGIGRTRLGETQRAVAGERGGHPGGHVGAGVAHALPESERLGGLEVAVAVLVVHGVVDRRRALHEHRRRELLLRV